VACFTKAGDGIADQLNWHQVIEERNDEMDAVVAVVLRSDPAALARVVAWINQRLTDSEYADQAKDSLREWLDLIRSRGLPGVLETLRDPGENARRLRHSSPFALIMPPKERVRILRRYETRRPRTHPAGV